MITMRNDPVIVLGMHRSGTTLLARILLDLGIFLGTSLTNHNESEYFLKQNEWLLRLAHGGWDNPMGFQNLLDEEETRTKCLGELKKKINGLQFRFSYLGLGNFTGFSKKSDLLWGWKDPRTTITWPLWKTLFPSAKCIFITRNGVDVANSLVVRENKRLGHIHNPFFSLRCTRLENAFALWEEYNEFFLKNQVNDPHAHVLQIRYEDLLADPVPWVDKITGFLGVTIDESKKPSIYENIDKSRRFGFIHNPSLVEFYNSVKDSPTMKKLGYDEISIPDKQS